jgi:hypothetical protein
VSQDCLVGLSCRDSIHPLDAQRLGIPGEQACNPDHPWCGSPRLNKATLALWERCGDERSLDFCKYVPIPRLVSCVPNLTAREKVFGSEIHSFLAAKATDIGGILSANRAKLTTWRTTYGVHRDCVLLVHQESLDPLQERFGTFLDRCDSFELLNLLGGRLVFVSPGYSVYDDGSMCPVRQVLNMRRSLFDAACANRAGLPSIPTLGWNSKRPEDIAFLSNWLARQGRKVRTLAVNAQTGTASNALAVALGSGMAEIERQAGRAFHWVVFGGRKRTEALCEYVPRRRITQISRLKDFSG